mmetsp:Transcript_17563/g.41383  ORF Transcript_17563/g.41383 Transcript_17563/m.41383 type:complete len:82 (-) Transcript_17563:48-293(-)
MMREPKATPIDFARTEETVTPPLIIGVTPLMATLLVPVLLVLVPPPGGLQESATRAKAHTGSVLVALELVVAALRSGVRVG